MKLEYIINKGTIKEFEIDMQFLDGFNKRDKVLPNFELCLDYITTDLLKKYSIDSDTLRINYSTFKYKNSWSAQVQD